MARTDEGKKGLKSRTLEFGVKYDGWLKPAETNDPYMSGRVKPAAWRGLETGHTL